MGIAIASASSFSSRQGFGSAQADEDHDAMSWQGCRMQPKQPQPLKVDSSKQFPMISVYYLIVLLFVPLPATTRSLPGHWMMDV
jgi:hypothetical protein